VANDVDAFLAEFRELSTPPLESRLRDSNRLIWCFVISFLRLFIRSMSSVPFASTPWHSHQKCQGEQGE